MSFDILLVPSSDSPSDADYERTLDDALAGLGASRPYGEWLLLSDGFECELSCGRELTVVTLRGEMPRSLADAMFAMAEATRSFVFIDSDAALRTPSNNGDGDFADYPVETVADSAALFHRLSPGFGAAAEYRDQIIASYLPESKPKTFLERLFGVVKS